MTIIVESLLDTEALFMRRRQAAYAELDVTVNNLIVAMYESSVEGRPESLEAIKELRARVKTAFPKPE